MAERLQVTILFTDMVGFTTFSERAGEEAAFRLIQELANLTGEAVREHGGAVQNFTGDGIMAVFGAPVAYEDSALRACRAAMGILERLALAQDDLQRRFGARPQLRIGVNSGVAVVGEVSVGDTTVMGDAVNIAARLQAIAEPGTAYLSEATKGLVDGQIEIESKGVRAVKGRAEPIGVFRLTGVRRGADRFAASARRGLSPFLGRERELDLLERNGEMARRELRVVHLVAEPGMGKSRLLHEFGRSLARGGVFVLLGHCSPDTRTSPFQPFIEVARNTLSLTSGESEADVARKLEAGLASLGKYSRENVALMLNLLGLPIPDGALAGLDGMLIGERTRKLLLDLFEARNRATPIALIIEDLHWTDGASEDLIREIVDSPRRFAFLLMLSQRPEYRPQWLASPNVAKLTLEPLPDGLVRRLMGTRLGVTELPDALARAMTERADGNALFAEEIVSYLSERGAVKADAGGVKYDAATISTALPMSLQSLLTARVGRLSPDHRSVLQAAAVIGRRFEPSLLAATIGSPDKVDAALSNAVAFDLAYVVGSTGDYEFKHALVRDALYQSLLSEPRQRLHLKIAEELELRGGNRLNEAAEVLALHYSETSQHAKAFVYMAMAAFKALRVYSFDEAGRWFDAAFSLLAKHADCADDLQVAGALADYVLFLNASFQPKTVVTLVERFRRRIDLTGDCQPLVVINHHYALALAFLGQYAQARAAQDNLNAAAARIADTPSAAYALASDLFLSMCLAPAAAEVDAKKAAIAIPAAAEVDDPYLQYIVRFSVGAASNFRGHANAAAEIAEDLLAVGRTIGDGRSIAYGMALKAIVAMEVYDYGRALEYTDYGITMARTVSDRALNRLFKIYALSALSRTECLAQVREFRAEATANGWGQFLDMSDGPYATALLANGYIGKGIRFLEDAIVRQTRANLLALANISRMILADVYLRIVVGAERPSLAVVLRNLPALLRARRVAEPRIRALMQAVRECPHVDREGSLYGRTELLLGLICKAKKRREEAKSHLIEARRILAQLAPAPVHHRLEQALNELQ